MCNGTDVKITVDDATKKWLEKVFNCNTEQALAAIVSAAGKKRSENGSS